MDDANGELDKIRADAHDPRGYVRPPALEERFAAAATTLVAGDHWRLPDGRDPPGPPELRCDLALEGGGVKGIGLVGAVLVLAEAGYRIQRVAGTSAGAIAASLIAGIVHRGDDMTRLKTELDGLQFPKFMDEGRVRRLISMVGRRPGTWLADAVVLATGTGLYSGDYLGTWLRPILESLGVTTFRTLAITEAEDEGMSLPPERRYRLVVHVSDISREELVRLPWDYNYYGCDRDEMDVVDAVRASMSIPFFFRPVTFTSGEARVPTPWPGGRTETEVYAPGTATWVDGGMLENFPIDAFDRMDGGTPRWPTIGIKLSALQTHFDATRASRSTIGLARHCLTTMMGEWNRYDIEETTAARTIFVDNAGVTATQFDLTTEQRDTLFRNGVAAATEFVIDMASNGHVPRDPDEAAAFVALRTEITEAAKRR